MATRPSSRDEFEVALVCALPLEYNAISLLFDEFWDEDGDRYGGAIGDLNTYTTGRFGNFDVVLVLLPNTGNVSTGDEILLGDVIISRTVIQYDYGRQYHDDFKARDTTEDILGRPNKDIRGLVTFLETELARERLEKRAAVFLKQIQDLPPKGNRRRADIYKYPGASSDRLFEANYRHKHYLSPQCSCAKVGCDDQHIIKRRRLDTNRASEQQDFGEESQTPSIFIGRFGSSGTVVKSGKHRDEIAKHYGVLAFETEAAGVWDELPCIIVKGVSNYADGHGSKHWQDFAAATAACVAKALVEQYPKTDKTFRAQIEQQMKELMENTESNKCLQDLRQTDPRDDKTRIQRTKGHLLKDSYRWILDHVDFKKWRYDSQHSLLWIKGDPGKGKTMLLCGIIDEIEESTTTQCLSYFFCQATELQLNNATAVLRGLIYMIIMQRPVLISHVRKKYDHSGKKLFEDGNGWEALSKTLLAILNDPSLTDVILIIDALDECVKGLSHLLDFINQASCSSRAKWIVSSRNWPIIEESLEDVMHGVKICLELNESLVSAAVQSFIRYKVQHLATKKSYDKNTQDEIEQYLMSNAHGTFLWVALVCQELADPRVRKRHTLQKLKSYPSGLDALYKRMMENIHDSLDAEVCQQILAITSVVYRPITLPELSCLMESYIDNDDDDDELKEIIGFCGSFLTIREESIYLIHQSAKDFLLEKVPDQILALGIEHQHHTIFSRSLNQLSKILHRNIYRLMFPGFPIEHVSSPDPDPLAPIRYSCMYWVDHLIASEHTRELSRGKMPRSEDTINTFFERRYLHWLEALSLLRSMSEGVLAMQKLERLQMPQLTELLEDANHFIRSHRQAIESAPLQVYTSALIFSPSHSRVRRLFVAEEPEWILTKPIMEKHCTGNCLRVLMGHEKPITSVAFSHDSALIASGSIDKTIRLWSTSTGDCIRDFMAKGELTIALAFSPDSALVASCSGRGIIQLWRTTTGKCVHELQGPNNKDTAVAFSHDSKLIVSASEDNTICIWSVDTGNCVQRLKGHGNDILSVAFSHDSKLIASASLDKTTRLWRVDTNGFQQEDPAVIISEGTLFVFSNDSTLVASVSGKIISLWCPHTGRCTQELKGHSEEVVSIAFSHDTALIASFSRDGSARLWCTDTGNCMLKLPRLNRSRKGTSGSVAFSHDSAIIAAGPLDNGSIQLWSVVDGKFLFEIPGEDPFVFSHDSSLIASLHLETENVRLWCTTTGDLVQELQSNIDVAIQSIVFSRDSALLAAIAGEELKLWSVASGECIQTLRNPTDMLVSVTISHDSTLVAALTDTSSNTIAVWRIDTGDLVQCVDLDYALHWYSRNLSFAKDKLEILTSIGVVAIDGTGGSIEWNPLPPRLVGLGIDNDRGWIMWNNYDILRLPAEFHDSGFAISGSTVAIRTASGRVIFIRLSADVLSDLYGEVDDSLTWSSSILSASRENISQSCGHSTLSISFD
ncbi:WD domain, g-beta repeat domain-containing protein [Trichoderma breve]|uniref:Mitochondrial division protein 1 n=1 Tax=Trichoderma breve TaxID=2034170 RepID=A0A9W9BCY5_9HYPO|nr:WD domain, g-beta repeat domain-containing protein [Trichoderma breve]KAJ4860159.1 WD domain, g-beta repeat domain-containing protein [Trichoderma breve]